jgi:hypothetical protein
MAIIIFSDSTLFAEKKEKKEKHWLSMVNLHCILENFKRIKKKKKWFRWIIFCCCAILREIGCVTCVNTNGIFLLLLLWEYQWY